MVNFEPALLAVDFLELFENHEFSPELEQLVDEHYDEMLVGLSALAWLLVRNSANDAGVSYKEFVHALREGVWKEEQKEKDHG